MSQTNQPQDKQSRAERLKRVRLMGGLSRREMCTDDSGLHPDTYKGWETARFGGLTERGAEKVVARLAVGGVVVSVDWLLYGMGHAPFEDLSCQSAHKTTLSDQDRQIARELLVFKEQENAVDMVMPDNAMAPLYLEGDVVAGLKCGQLQDAIGLECIVQIECGDVVFRKVHAGSSEGLYTLLALDSAFPILSDVKILMAAPAIWWRRTSK